ncbi:cytochrome c [Psychromarinibacter sp. C21-152]|uniref:Cytochrome c n=1 Tax=Psychromarinibacter sediminicola TaxID=3033385 RepID=A0AAE3NSN9_9RHOB|nr:cytochrome c [Psychromarinibacter sediminicola]MDF0603543.1 cytochrome c [Psychromarinibacter sediminicola]
MRSLLVFLLILLATDVAGGDVDVDADALERLVRQDCGSCHGMTLKGGLGPDLRAESVAHYDREGLAFVILNGIPGTPMPPWSPLMTEEEAGWIADYLLEGESE